MALRKFVRINPEQEWCCPDITQFVDQNGNVVGYQTHPTNTFTQSWADQEGKEHWGPVDLTEFKEVFE